ncbi:MAG: hypothetical protein KGO96_10700 [Elusimicrobia bacterium]|nr:hypothetical protein [Elusimicrobiota bacterium]MDE2426361.1 hypothetical protein [Elusimicrobiota bacterium]
MSSLLADFWFWVSAAGFLTSGLLFVFLLGRYRAAVESEDEALDAELPQPVPLEEGPAEPLSEPEPLARPQAVEPLARPQPAEAVAAADPILPYLQGLEAQLGRIDRDLAALKSLTSRQASQGEAILEAVFDLSRRLERRKQAPAAQPAAAQASEEPAAQAPQEPAAPALEPAAVLEPAQAASEAQAEPVAVESAKPARKGPVWPI